MVTKELDVEDFVENEVSDFEEFEEHNDTPNINDEGWVEYVIGLLREDEQVDGRPTVDGLRRLTEELLGEIVTCTTKVHHNTESYASTTVRIELGDGRIMDGSADANENNTKFPYSKYLVAMAETRAEGRALRKLLRLRVASVEEVDNQEDTSLKEEKVSDSQIKALSVVCERADINVQELINGNHEKGYNILEASKQEVLDLFKIVKDYQESEVPATLVGYDKNW